MFNFLQNWHLIHCSFFSLTANLLTIAILIRGNCGLSKCVTCYLVAMATADVLVIILEVIFKQIPHVYLGVFVNLMQSIYVCHIHFALLQTAKYCSVWFTIIFTFDRFVAICCSKLKSKYCTTKIASVTLGSVTVLSCLLNVFWCFFLTGAYNFSISLWFCLYTPEFVSFLHWAVVEFINYIINPCVPFVLIILLNVLTVRHILVSSRARKRLRVQTSGQSRKDPEMENRRKSIVLLFAVSANFILLWVLILIYSIWNRLAFSGYTHAYIDSKWFKLGSMLQLMSCCTNTCIYAMTQSKFREQWKRALIYPFSRIMKFLQWFKWRGISNCDNVNVWFSV